MKNRVTVYGASWCGPCQQVKKYLNDRDISFDYVDIDEDPEAMPEGYTSIPVIEFDGYHYAGYNKEVLSRIANQDLQ
jgi:mycoredoxin